MLCIRALTQMQRVNIIVACAKSNGIGNKGSIPWTIKKDMTYFKKVTMAASPGKENGVIMGWKTYNSIPKQFAPLNGRINVVVSTTIEEIEGVFVAKSFDEAVEHLRKNPLVDKIFAIGGAQIYSEAITRDDCGSVYFTRILEPSYECDVYFPAIDEKKFRLASESEIEQEGENKYQFLVYDKIVS